MEGQDPQDTPHGQVFMINDFDMPGGDFDCVACPDM